MESKSSKRTKICIDLFAGLGGFSAAFRERDDWIVFTVEKHEYFKRTIDLDPWGIETLTVEQHYPPDIQADILELSPTKLLDLIGYDRGDIDVLVVTGSPPCHAFSCGGRHTDIDEHGRPVSDFGRTSIALAHHTRGLCEALDPDWYWIENPQGGMRNVLGKPQGTVWYCQYGEDRAKPTFFWGRIPPTFEWRTCHNGNDDCHHEPASRGSDAGTQASNLTKPERAKVPYEVSREILEAVESAPDRSELDVETDDTRQGLLTEVGALAQ